MNIKRWSQIKEVRVDSGPTFAVMMYFTAWVTNILSFSTKRDTSPNKIRGKKYKAMMMMMIINDITMMTILTNLLNYLTSLAFTLCKFYVCRTYSSHAINVKEVYWNEMNWNVFFLYLCLFHAYFMLILSLFCTYLTSLLCDISLSCF